MAKKICYITTISGTMGFFTKQLIYLAKNGFEVCVICSDDGRLPKELYGIVKFIPVDIPRGFAFIKSFKAIKCLKKIFAKEKFDLIQYSTPNAAFYSSIAAKKVGCPVRIYHLMGLRYLGATGITRKLLKIIEKITCKNSTNIECVSNSNMILGIKEDLFNYDKVNVLWNGSSGGVDCKRFNIENRKQWRNEIRKKIGYSDSDFVYGFVGRITKDKGINELFEAFFSLHNGEKLLLIGRFEGSDSLNQELLLRAKQSSNVLFVDYVTDIERYFAAIDVLVLPSYREGFGNVIIEAGAVGTPAIVSDIPGPIDAICEGVTGLTVKVKDSLDLSNKMRDIKEINYISMGEKASDFVKENFDSEKLCEVVLTSKKHLIK